MKTTARVVAADGVTLNGVLPWGLDTPRVRSLDEGRAARSGRSFDEVRAEQIAAIPANRYGRPEELGSLVAYLCSEPAGFVTGTFTPVDGGYVAGLF
jgi:3-oxoacyl-[acyl-carrier protein] reductase